MANIPPSEIIQRISALEERVQSGALTSEKGLSGIESEQRELEQAIKELKNIVQSLDKETAIQAEKQSHLYYQIVQLEKTVDSMKGDDSKEVARKRDLVEKIFMAVIGALVTYIFGLLRQ